jgi:hypothetical protein
MNALPVEMSNVLWSLTREKGVTSKTMEAVLGSLLLPTNSHSTTEWSHLLPLCRILLQMVLTSVAVFRLIQVTTPEALFVSRCVQLLERDFECRLCVLTVNY